jgi:exopolysaccharide biosynthesis polyprenyl glycosylphosphotransferase
MTRGRSLAERIQRRLVGTAGRVVLVWLGIAIIAAAQHPLHLADLAGVSIAAAIWLVTLRGAHLGAPEALGTAVPSAIGTASGLVAVAAVNPLLPGMHQPVTVLLGMALAVFASSVAWESVLRRARGRRRILVIGSSAMADISAIADRVHLPFEILGTGEPAPTLPAGDAAEAPVTSVLPLNDLAAVVSTQRPDLIVLTDEASCAEALDSLLEIQRPPFRVAGVTSFCEHAFGCVPLPHLTSMWFMSLLHVRQPADRPSKRLFDIVVATLGLVIAAPVVAVLALLIKRTPGPVIYRQTRVGERGRRFTMYKLRTMTAGAERPGTAVWCSGDADPRATTIGRLLRKTHLDELPQLWNVLKGEMSIVGPRPERPEFIELLETEVPFWSRRLLIRPGITGWAQVRCGYARDSDSAAEKLSYDFWYLRHGNLAVDLSICLRTVLLALGAAIPRLGALRRPGPTERLAR